MIKPQMHTDSVQIHMNEFLYIAKYSLPYWYTLTGVAHELGRCTCWFHTSGLLVRRITTIIISITHAINANTFAVVAREMVVRARDWRTSYFI